MKKSARREQLQREEAEQRRLKTVLELQFILDRLGDDTVRQDLKQGVGGSPLLTDADLAAFDDFYKLVGPDRDQSIRSVQKVENKRSFVLQHLNQSNDWDFVPDVIKGRCEKYQIYFLEKRVFIQKITFLRSVSLVFTHM